MNGPQGTLPDVPQHPGYLQLQALVAATPRPEPNAGLLVLGDKVDAARRACLSAATACLEAGEYGRARTLERAAAAIGEALPREWVERFERERLSRITG